MSKTRIMEEAQREKYIRSDLEYYHFLKELENLGNEMEKLSGEEKEKWKEKYNAKIEERLRSLREEIEAMKRRYNGTPWDFSYEKALDIFVEDADIM